MAVRNIEDIMSAIRERVGEDTSDETLSFIEDVSDTMNSLSNAEEWRQKYEQNDAEWRERYRNRFFGSTDREDEREIEPEVEKEQLTFESLFN